MAADLQKAREAADLFRQNHVTGKPFDRYPLDTLFIADNELRMDLIPFPGLQKLLGAAAAIMPSLKEMYVDDDLHAAYTDDKAKAWEVDRLRFSIAHEIGHCEMHAAAVSKIRCDDIAKLLELVNRDDAIRYELEQEANEFAGRLIAPLPKLKECVDAFGSIQAPRWRENRELRDAFCKVAGKQFGLNAREGMPLRLNREGLWPDEWLSS